jgi:predicted aminopeptidase
MKPFAFVVLAAAAFVLTGCSTAEFYLQGVTGEIDLLSRARPISVVLENARDPLVRAKLERVVAIRDFASRDLGLPDNLSYKRYTEIERRFVTWNVFATPELSLTALQWCFPIAGCVNYRGYFHEDDARAEAAKLAAKGDDVYIGGVPAFSTLGYFADPMLSTFIRYPDVEIARLIFHELAHQVVYAKDDTVFNESYAVTVEEEGLRRWLAAQHDPELDRQYALSERYRTTFRRLVDATRARLEKLYAGAASVAAKRAGKAEAFAAMREEYEATKRAWGGFSVYDYWFQQGPNNASLAAVGLYTDKVPEFRSLLAAAGGDLPRFYARVKELAALPKGQREAALEQAAGMASSHAAQ